MTPRTPASPWRCGATTYWRCAQRTQTPPSRWGGLGGAGLRAALRKGSCSGGSVLGLCWGKVQALHGRQAGRQAGRQEAAPATCHEASLPQTPSTQPTYPPIHLYPPLVLLLSLQWDDFAAKNNAELNDNLGNFVNRTLKFIYTRWVGGRPGGWEAGGGCSAWAALSEGNQNSRGT